MIETFLLALKQLASNNQNILLLLIVLGFVSCQSQNSSEETGTSKENIIVSDTLQIIRKLTNFFPISDSLNAVLVVPVDVSCPACRDKCINFISKNSVKKLKTVLTSANEDGAKKMKKIVLDKHLENKSNIYQDDKNFCFLNDIAFVKPVIYWIENQKIIQMVELVPLNIDDELNKIITKLK